MTPAAQTPCVIYARVSTREQGESGLGLDAQEAACREEAERRGWVVLSVHREVISGGKRTKPVFDQAAQEARDAGAVLMASKADRVSRASTASVLTLHERAHAEGWYVFTMDMPEIDTTSPAGELMLTVMAAIARYERRLIGQRTKEALAIARAKGTKTGNPIGRPRTLALSTVERIYALRDGGHSLQRIADILNADGVPGGRGGRWSKQRVHKTIKRYRKA